MTRDHTVLASKFCYLKLNSFTGSFASGRRSRKPFCSAPRKPFCSAHCYRNMLEKSSCRKQTFAFKCKKKKINTERRSVKYTTKTLPHLTPSSHIHTTTTFLKYLSYHKKTEQAVIWWPTDNQNKQIHTAVRSATTPTVNTKVFLCRFWGAYTGWFTNMLCTQLKRWFSNCT